MPATDQLRDEHRGVEAMLAAFEGMLDRLEAGERVAPDDLRKAIDFFTVFVDQCHHAKEEEYLFPELEREGVAYGGRHIAALLADHARGRDLLRALQGEVGMYADGPRDIRSALVTDGRAYRQRLLLHIHDEENVLTAAEPLIGDATDQRLMAGFDAIEEERIGAGRHEQFHRDIENLTAKYAGHSTEDAESAV